MGDAGAAAIERAARPFPLWKRAVHVCVRSAVRAFCRVYFRWRIEGGEDLPESCVLVANHSSFLDPVVLGAASSRVVTFLMTSTTFREPALRWFYELYEAIPLDPRGGNRDALRRARAALEAGKVVGVFPEGGISRDGLPILGNPGAVSLVLAKGVSVVPVGLVGVSDALPYEAGFPRPRKIRVRFGRPIPAEELMVGGDRKERLNQATTRIMREIAALCGRVAREDELIARNS